MRLLNLCGLTVVLAIIGLVSCAESESPAQTFQVRGQVIGSRFEGAALRIAHEEIPGYMEAMTMDFKLRDPADGEVIEPGDKIQFRYVVERDDSYIDRIEYLDPNTELNLAGGAH